MQALRRMASTVGHGVVASSRERTKGIAEKPSGRQGSSQPPLSAIATDRWVRSKEAVVLKWCAIEGADALARNGRVLRP